MQTHIGSSNAAHVTSKQVTILVIKQHETVITVQAVYRGHDQNTPTILV